MNNIFYTYGLLDQNNIPFYIGKGKEDRDQTHFWPVNVNPNDLDFKLSHKDNKIRKIYKETGSLPKIIRYRENISEREAFDLEIELIKKYGRIDLGLGPLTNHTDGGEGSSGLIVSEETRKKLSITMTGRIISKETREKMSKSAINKTKSLETCRRMSIARKSKVCTSKARKNMSIAKKGENHPLYGKSPSEETCLKMSKANSGKNHHMYGKHHSEETKKKLSISCSRYLRYKILLIEWMNSLREDTVINLEMYKQFGYPYKDNFWGHLRENVPEHLELVIIKKSPKNKHSKIIKIILKVK